MNSPPAPREQLSERVQRLAHFADAHCGEDELLMLLVRAIREQQAALIAVEDYVRSCANSPQVADALLATINKWRIE